MELSSGREALKFVMVEIPINQIPIGVEHELQCAMYYIKSSKAIFGGSFLCHVALILILFSFPVEDTSCVGLLPPQTGPYPRQRQDRYQAGVYVRRVHHKGPRRCQAGGADASGRLL